MIDVKQYIFIFMLFSFLGWLNEVIRNIIMKGKFINRGFLIGPYCPIYGFGVIIILNLVEKYMGNFWAIFILSILICGILEYLTSYLMEKIFHTRWWDYSNRIGNINGRICIGNLIQFGIGSVLVIYIIFPLLLKGLKYIPNILLLSIDIIFLIIFVIDLICSAVIIFNLTREEIFSKDSTAIISRKVINKLKQITMS